MRAMRWLAPAGLALSLLVGCGKEDEGAALGLVFCG
jgi:hypothetical protein